MTDTWGLRMEKPQHAHRLLPILGNLALLWILLAPESHGWALQDQVRVGQPRLVFEETARYEESVLFSANPDSFLGVASAIAVGSDKVFIWDSANYNIKVFPHDLSHMQALGRSGAGPGEFSRYVRQLVAYHGGVIALDYGNQRLTVYSEDGSFAYSVPYQIQGGSRPCLAVDENTNRAFLLYQLGSTDDCLIETLYLGPTGVEHNELLPGREDYERYNSGISQGNNPTGLFSLGNESLLLVWNAITSPDASSVQAYLYTISEHRLSPPMSVLPKEMKELAEAQFRRTQERAQSRARRSSGGIGNIRFWGLRPITGMLTNDNGKIILVAFLEGERYGIMLDLDTGTAISLGSIPISSNYFGAYGNILYVASETEEGPTITGYRMIVRY